MGKVKVLVVLVVAMFCARGLSAPAGGLAGQAIAAMNEANKAYAQASNQVLGVDTSIATIESAYTQLSAQMSAADKKEYHRLLTLAKKSQKKADTEFSRAKQDLDKMSAAYKLAVTSRSIGQMNFHLSQVIAQANNVKSQAALVDANTKDVFADLIGINKILNSYINP